ncbi:hypothetical protein [Mycoplasma sp. 1654_15]|uniref:hypothetical protein n=1 Tax=Mycoplasma sp. 1654_15 TaxID=2725994 RepID=UPI001448B3F4|nr:hypothetical protein [Mycoplasma sp. 1654_15]QJB71048.1 hypothetical protein HF996_00790 [Mycoplasma sp. 1654_15]
MRRKVKILLLGLCITLNVSLFGWFTYKMIYKYKSYSQTEQVNFFDKNLKKIEKNFSTYQSKYFMNSYWVSQDTLLSTDELGRNPNNPVWPKNQVPRDFELKKQMEKNRTIFNNFMDKIDKNNNILKSMKDFEELDSEILVPVFKKYFSKFFPSETTEQILEKYNIYYSIKNYNPTLQYINKNQMGWWVFDGLISKKLYFIDPDYFIRYHNDSLPYFGAQISIVAFIKEEEIHFSETTKPETIVREIYSNFWLL